MNSSSHTSASARLDDAQKEEATAADELHAAQGTSGEMHAAVQLRAAEEQVEARTAWLSWVDRGDESH